MKRSEWSDTVVGLMDMMTNERGDEKDSLEAERTPRRSRLSAYSSRSADSPMVKTEDMNTNWIISPCESMKIRGDLIDSRSQILNLECHIARIETAWKEEIIMLETKVNKLEEGHKRDVKTIEDLKQDVAELRERELQAKNELVQAKSNIASERLTQEGIKRQLENTINKLRSIIARMESREDLNCSMWERQMKELETARQLADQDAESHRRLVKELQSKLTASTVASCQMELKELALQEANQEIRRLQSQLDELSQFKFSLTKIVNFDDMEAEVKSLRVSNQRLSEGIRNQLLLEEGVDDPQQKNHSMKESGKRNLLLQEANAQLGLELEQWRSAARGMCKTPAGEQPLPAQLKQHDAGQAIKIAQLESQLKATEKEMNSRKLGTEQQTQAVADLMKAQASHQTLIRRLQKKLQLISGERDSYRQQLDAYEKDLTICQAASSPTGQTKAMATLQEANRNLEASLASYRKMVAQLEEDLRQARPELDSDGKGCPAQLEQISKLKADVERLEEENKELRRRREELEAKLKEQAAGYSHVRSGKVLNMQQNPTVDKVAAYHGNLAKMGEENDRLKRKIKAMEQGNFESSSNVTLLGSKERLELEERARSAELKADKLREAFKTSQQEFRDACYMMFGYQVDVASRSIYKLTSMYADNESDSIFFQVNDNGTLNLLESSFSSSLGQLVELHLAHQQSVPVFLSAVTMELFSHVTMLD